jgi:ABC-type Na+ transport system ATPase subunit NatA
MSLPIETNNLIKRYGNKIALNNVTLRIEAPKIIGLVGRNGAGKTSFLKTCAGLLRPTAGEIRVWGEPPFDNLRVLSQLAFIGEETQYDNRLRVKEIMELGAIYYRNWDQDLAGKLLKRFELDPDLKYKSLSLGMKTKFKVIMGLASRVPLVLFDEPTLGMDAVARKEFYHALINDYSEYPRAFILSGHLPGEVENLIEEAIRFVFVAGLLLINALFEGEGRNLKARFAFPINRKIYILAGFMAMLRDTAGLLMATTICTAVEMVMVKVTKVFRPELIIINTVGRTDYWDGLWISFSIIAFCYALCFVFGIYLAKARIKTPIVLGVLLVLFTSRYFHFGIDGLFLKAVMQGGAASLPGFCGKIWLLTIVAYCLAYLPLRRLEV